MSSINPAAQLYMKYSGKCLKQTVTVVCESSFAQTVVEQSEWRGVIFVRGRNALDLRNACQVWQLSE